MFSQMWQVKKKKMAEMFFCENSKTQLKSGHDILFVTQKCEENISQFRRESVLIFWRLVFAAP